MCVFLTGMRVAAAPPALPLPPHSLSHPHSCPRNCSGRSLLQTVRKVHATAAYTADSTFEELVPHEISAKGLAKVRKDKTSATIGTLWMKRALSFICMFLKLLVESDAPSKDVAYQTYQTILKPYHGWLASKGVGMTMSMVPYRATIFTSLGFADAAEAKEKLSALVAAIEPALNDLNTRLAAQGADFPDKV